MRRCLLIGFGAFSITHGIGLLFGSPLLPSAAVLAWATLFGYAVITNRDRVIPAPLPAHSALLLGLLALGALALHERISEGGWTGTEDMGRQFLSTAQFAPDYRGPLGEAALLAVGYGGLAVAVLARPARTSRRAALIGAAVGAGGALGYLILRLSTGLAWGYGVMAFVALVLAMLAFAVAGAAMARRAGVLLILGSSLIALATLAELDRHLMELAFSSSTGSDRGVVVTSAYYQTRTLSLNSPAITDAVLALVPFAGAAAVVLGHLRRQ